MAAKTPQEWGSRIFDTLTLPLRNSHILLSFVQEPAFAAFEFSHPVKISHDHHQQLRPNINFGTNKPNTCYAEVQ